MVSEVSTFPSNPDRWYSVNVTNNIIASNVSTAGTAPESHLQDSLVGRTLVNNTIVDNDSPTARLREYAFHRFLLCGPDERPHTLPRRKPRCVPVTSLNQRRRLGATAPGSASRGIITCPAGHTGSADNSNHSNSACRTVSFPTLYNDVIWHNRAFSINVVTPATGTQQSTITRWYRR